VTRSGGNRLVAVSATLLKDKAGEPSQGAILGQRQRHEDWLDLGRALTRRGLRPPFLVVTDGAPGLGRAVEELWADADRQRCALHRLRNILAQLPKDTALHERIRKAYWAALDEAQDRSHAENRQRALVAEWERSFPSAAACLANDLSALTAHLRYPGRLRRRLRSTNLLERSREEDGRRTQVIGRFPGETSCLSLCWAVLDCVITGARELRLTELEREELSRLQEPPVHREKTA
jgi:transposase-like protein